MRILMTPQMNEFESLKYKFDGKKITISHYEILFEKKMIGEEPSKEDFERGIKPRPKFETVEIGRNKIGEDTFDFGDLPDGELELYDNEGNLQIQTSLNIVPILSAKKENGILYDELLNFIGENATEEERFPEWQVVENG